jgi:hypothetical protein
MRLPLPIFVVHSPQLCGLTPLSLPSTFLNLRLLSFVRPDYVIETELRSAACYLSLKLVIWNLKLSLKASELPSTK